MKSDSFFTTFLLLSILPLCYIQSCKQQWLIILEKKNKNWVIWRPAGFGKSWKFSFAIHEGLLRLNLVDLCNMTLNKPDKILTSVLSSDQQVSSATGCHFSVWSTDEMQTPWFTRR